MKVEQHILDEIRDIAPTLIKVGRENPFRVPPQYWSTLEQKVLGDLPMDDIPDQYFDGLADQVLAQANQPQKAKVIPFNYRALLSVASIMLIGVLAYMTWSIDETNMDSMASTETAAEEFDFLLDNEQLQLTDVLDLLDDEVFEDLEIGDTDEIEIDFLDDDLHDYTEEELEDLL